jgi:MFS family permease
MWSDYLQYQSLTYPSVGSLGAGSLTNTGTEGWRNVFWVQAALHGVLVLMLLFLYYPPKRSDYPKMKPLEYVWSLDPVGCLLFVSGSTLVILALDWTGGTYPWSNAHIGAPLGVGIALLIGFGLYGTRSLGIAGINWLMFHQSGRAGKMGSSLM